MKTIIILLFSFLSIFCKGKSFSAPEDSTSNVNFGINGDFVSRYIWRGIPLSLSPNIQPYTSLGYKNLTLGAWGSYSLFQPYAEVDLNIKYSIGPVTFGFNDYYNEDENNLSLNDYFKWSNPGTPHSLEASVSFNGTDKIPFSLIAATYFYGNDKDTLNNNYYSTYLELSYPFNFKEYELSVFLGGTINEGFYADKAAIVNLGLNASKDIKISDRFSLPVFSSFIVNPYAKDVFFVFGITF